MTFWTDGEGRAISEAEALERLSRPRVVLLGETHDRADHHLWQLQVTEALAARRPLVLAFEMFPARLDPVLADWGRGGLSEAEFLSRTDWDRTWGFPAELYLPLLRFCRRTGTPLVGLNVARDLVRAVGAGGWQAVPRDQREGLTPARPSSPAYRRFLFELTGGPRPDRAAQSPGDPAFDRFVRAQEVWDRAFACRIAAASQARPGALVVGIVGQGHLGFGGGVTWQLADLGETAVTVAIPADEALPAGMADLVFRCR